MSENVDQNNIQQHENENTCVVCFKKTFIFSIGSCNHPVCYECSARMRCLCLQNECPICRQDLPRVIFTKTIDLFLTLDKTTRSGLYEKKFRIVFSDLEIQKAFYHLLEHRCPKCEDNNLFVDFYKLKEHVRKVHEQFYCEICTENLKVFSSERRAYTRSELAQHRRVGDPDNKSHKGHPRCDYCELRYLDKDELFRHLRREHYFCHLCDADGVNLFYGTVREMRDHFKAEHFLCEEEDCLEEEFTAVYRTEIDLRAHKATVHSKSMSRMEARQARTLELDFSYGPRGRGGGNENSNRNPRIRTNDTQREFDINPEPQIVQKPPIQIDTKNEEHFPSLAGPSNLPNAPVQLANSVRHVYYGQQGLARTKENFPALGGSGTVKTNNVQSKQNNGNKQSSSSKQSGPTASSLFKASANKSASSTAPQQNKQQKPQSTTSNSYKKDSIADFPSLGPSSGPSKNTFFNESSKFSSSQSIDRKSTTSVASKSSATTATNKKNTSNDFPPFVSAASKKRDLLMEDLTLPSNNNIDKGIIAAKHKGLMNDYVSVASQMTKVSLVKQKEETVIDQQQFVPKLSSENNFPTLGASDSASKPPQWITVNSKNNNNNNNQKQQPQQNVGNKNSNNPKKQQQNEVPQKNQKTNGTKKVNNDENKKTSTNEKKIVKDNTNKENRTMLESQLVPSAKPPPPGFKQIQPVTSKYHPVPDASKRNQGLVEEFQKVLKTNESMQEFRLLSQMFRDGNYFARSYYESCKGVLGEKFDSLFPELLVLLPDIDRQQKLYRIHLEESLTDVDITDDTTSKKKNKKSQKTLEVCATCQQVLLSKDLLVHVQSHSLENNFPTLSNEISSTKAAGWKK